MIADGSLPGYAYALLAHGFFRKRHDRKARFKNAARKTNLRQSVPLYRENVRLSRKFIALAREKGWKGSIAEAAALQQAR